MKVKRSTAAPTNQPGQVWRLNGDVSCHIGEVGRRLVHYKLFKGKPVRIPSTLGNLETLTRHLKINNAVLVKD